MAGRSTTTSEPTRILHVFRAPLGGLFRHVCDLAAGQKRAGYQVGIVCGEVPCDEVAARKLDELSQYCELGIHTLPMNRLPGIGDAVNILQISALVRRLKIDVVHGHGAKGGAYARLLPRMVGSTRIYTPHGGSLHFDARNIAGFAFLNAEKMMRRRTDAFIFESEFGLQTFTRKIGYPSGLFSVIHNGVNESEFKPVADEQDLADFVFVGELRELKGLGTLIDAATLAGHPIHLRIVGSGAERERFEAQAADVPACVKIEFLGSMPARQAFGLGRNVVVPSYHESLPYIVLEAAAAGKPVIATRVGGMTEIFGADSTSLVDARDVGGLADRLRYAINHPDEMAALATRLQSRVQSEFSVGQMVESIDKLYHRMLANRRTTQSEYNDPASRKIEEVPL
ncbi:MAG: glycosyltransferase family 4 protein [Parvibaculum sp.]